MIHITIPDTNSLIEPGGIKKYDAFNLHINGAYHASVRYSSLLRFQEMLRREFASIAINLPPFPPKKLLHQLNSKALTERRLALARYLHGVIQQPELARHPLTEQYFLNIQVESYRPSSSNVNVDIYLGDGLTAEPLRCSVDHSTNTIMLKLAQQIGMDAGNVEYFGLFLCRERHSIQNGHPSSSKDGGILCVRLLRNFESPYISLQLVNQKSVAEGFFHKLVVRKLIWDPRIEQPLLDDAGAVLLLYKQAISDRSSSSTTTTTNKTIDEDKCVQYLKKRHQDNGYSYEILQSCISDYPKTGTKCKILVGRRQIMLEFQEPGQVDIYAEQTRALFRATRIRVWRISSQQNSNIPGVFTFEYLIAKDKFEWITLNTDQAILLSLLLQSIGAEILKEARSNDRPPPREELPKVAGDVLQPKNGIATMNGTEESAHDDRDGYQSLRDVFLLNAVGDYCGVAQSVALRQPVRP